MWSDLDIQRPDCKLFPMVVRVDQTSQSHSHPEEEQASENCELCGQSCESAGGNYGKVLSSEQTVQAQQSTCGTVLRLEYLVPSNPVAVPLSRLEWS